jgi:hypothetical protein
MAGAIRIARMRPARTLEICMYFKARQNIHTCLITYLVTYLLRAAVFLEKLTGSQLVKEFPAFYGTRIMFITVFKSARHLSVS